jgi:membrane protein
MVGSRLISTVRKFLKELFLTWGTARSPQAAAALAYYGMFSFAPIIFIAVSVAGIFFDTLIAAQEVLVRLEDMLGPEVTQFILDVVVRVSQGASGATPLTTLIGFIALLFAASGLFAQLQYALNNIWEVPPPTQRGILAIVISRLLAFVMVIGLGLLLVLVTVSSIILSTVSTFLNLDNPLPVTELAVFLGLATVVFALIYKVLPDVDIAWRDVWLGALVTALLFALARSLLGIFLAYTSFASAFDAAGALAVILIVIYYLALIFLFGAVFTKVYASMFGSKAGSTPE